MYSHKFYIKIIICIGFMFSCGGKDVETEASPDIKIKDNDFSEDLNIERNLPEIIDDLRMDIKKLKINPTLMAQGAEPIGTFPKGKKKTEPEPEPETESV